MLRHHNEKNLKNCNFQQESHIQKLLVAATYAQLQLRKIKDNHAAHNHCAIHKDLKQVQDIGQSLMQKQQCTM